MRYTSTFLSILLIALCSVALATEPSTAPATAPSPTFTRLVAALDGNDARLSWNNEEKAKAFNNDRAAMGADFEPALARFVGTSIQRHYWVAQYLTQSVYLGKNSPDFKLGLLMLEQGIVLNDAAKDEMTGVSLDVCACLLAQRLGLEQLAVMHKTRAERAMKTEVNQGGFPALDDEDHKLYDSIKIADHH